MTRTESADPAMQSDAFRQFLDAARPSTGARLWVVDRHHDHADDTGPGDEKRPLATIGAAARQAGPGDVIRIHAGVYHERVAPACGGEPGRPIVYEAAVGERVVVRGTQPWAPAWQPVQGPVVRAELDPALFAIDDPAAGDAPPYNPFQRTLSAAPGVRGKAIDLFGHVHGEDEPDAEQRRLVVGQLFADDEPLTQVATRSELARLPGAWLADEAGTSIELHPPHGPAPLEKLALELTTRRCVFAPWQRGLGHIHVRGLVLERSASDFPSGFYTDSGAPQAGVLSTRSGHDWRIEHCTIRFGTSLGIDLGTEGRIDGDGLGQPQRRPGEVGRHVVRHNTISDNGGGGIMGLGSFGTQILCNRIERNNRLGFSAPETGGIKLHFFQDGLIAGNLVRDNRCYGIWLDNMWHRARITRNAVLANAGAGLFLELGNGPLMVDHNVVALTTAGVREPGDGIYSHDASGITLAHNLVMDNAHLGLHAHAATDRRPGLYKDGRRVGKTLGNCSNWRVVNNCFFANHAGAVAFPPEHERSTGNVIDANAYTGSFDRWTHETHGQPMDAPLFNLLDNKGRLDRAALVDAILAKLADAGVPEADRPSRARLLRVPVLTLEEWRIGMGFDARSRAIVLLRPDVAAGAAAVSLTLGPDLAEIATEPVEGLDRDWYGAPLGERPLPGPFQNLTLAPALAEPGNADDPVAPYSRMGAHRENHLRLWPMPLVDQPSDASHARP